MNNLGRARLGLMLLSLSGAWHTGCAQGMRPLFCLASQPSYQAAGRTQTPASLMIYEGEVGPLSYRASTAADANAQMAQSVREVVGKACQKGIDLPLAAFFRPNKKMLPSIGVGWGDGAYQEALAEAQAQAPDSVLSNVRADVQLVNVLLVWRKQCLVVTADATKAAPGQIVTVPGAL